MANKITLVQCPCEISKEFPIVIDIEIQNEKNVNSTNKTGTDVLVNCPSCGESLVIKIAYDLKSHNVFLSKIN